MTLVECNYAWSVCTHMCLVYAHGMEVAVSFYFTHTGIVNYCIPAGRASATLLTRSFLLFAGWGWHVRLEVYLHTYMYIALSGA